MDTDMDTADSARGAASAETPLEAHDGVPAGMGEAAGEAAGEAMGEAAGANAMAGRLAGPSEAVLMAADAGEAFGGGLVAIADASAASRSSARRRARSTQHAH